MNGGLPTAAFNDLVVHPRDNDLILGTHGRGIWILDNVNALQEMSPEILDSPAHLFSMEPAEQIRYRSEKGHSGDMIFRGTNPAPGALIDYWLREDGTAVTLSILDPEGTEVARIPDAPSARGVHRVVWNLRHDGAGPATGPSPRGPLVTPGTYTVRLEVGEAIQDRALTVREDPRLTVDPGVRAQWTLDLLALFDLVGEARSGAESMASALGELEGRAEIPRPLVLEGRDLERQWGELASRARRLYGEVEGWVGPPTQQQSAQWAYYQEMLETLSRESQDWQRRVPALVQERGGGGA
jgi:hypothetical protein